MKLSISKSILIEIKIIDKFGNLIILWISLINEIKSLIENLISLGT